MKYYLRKAIASRIEPGKTLYKDWAKEFKTFEEAVMFTNELKYGDCFDILDENGKVLLEHTKGFDTGVQNKRESSVSGAEPTRTI